MKSRSVTYILFDDDCGVCTKFSKILATILGNKSKIVPMHIPAVEQEGIRMIGNDYWKSFHVVKDRKWTTQGDAIIALASIFPAGNILKRVVQFPPLFWILNKFLKLMQNIRDNECSINTKDSPAD